jgi:site-specific DNA recombinase
MNRLGHRLSRSQARRILTSTVYRGAAHFMQRQRVKGKAHRFRPESEWIPITVPAIVSGDVWHRAQEQLRRNKATLAGQQPARSYLLRGLLFCGRCGRKFAGNFSHARREYRCTSRDRLAAQRCHAPAIRADFAEAAVWDRITFALSHPEVMTPHIERRRAKSDTRDIEVRSEAEHLRRQIAEAERQETRLLAHVSLFGP